MKKLLLVGWLVLLAALSSMAQRPDMSKVGIDQKLGSQAPMDIALLDETGQNVKLGDYFGKKPVVLMLIFYRCKSGCAIEFEGTVGAINAIKRMALGRDYDVVTVSINPKETPELARAKKESYAGLIKAPGDATGWHFLTGPQESIKRLTEAVGFRYTYDPAKDLINHATGLFVLTPDGRVSKVLYGSDYVAKTMLRSLDIAAEGKLGQIDLEPKLFGCLQVDPATGRVTVNVLRTMQVLCGITLAALIVWITIMSLKNRRTALKLEAQSGGGKITLG